MKKKLSTAQVYVIEMMQEGWKLKNYSITHPDCPFTTSVQKATIKSLVDRRLITLNGEYYSLSLNASGSDTGK